MLNRDAWFCINMLIIVAVEVEAIFFVVYDAKAISVKIIMIVVCLVSILSNHAIMMARSQAHAQLFKIESC